MEELQEALQELQQLSRDVQRGDIEDQFQAVGTFLLRKLDSVIANVENTLEVMKDNADYISDLESQVEDLKSKVGDAQ